MTDPEEEHRAIIRKILDQRGSSFVRGVINETEEAHELTIISNSGMHPIPAELIRGELYVASEGSLDFSTIDSVNAEYDAIVKRIHNKLNEKTWSKIFLFPFGHSTLCMNIKLAVYRVLRIETIDFFYFGSGKYGLLERDTRSVLTDAKNLDLS